MSPRSFGLAILLLASSGVAQAPNGVGLVRVLGPHATSVLAPKSGRVGALVAIPDGHSAEELGLIPFVPGVGRLRGSAEDILAFGAAHPDLRVEVSPPLRPLLANAQLWVRAATARQDRGADGSNVLVGVIDTGIDSSLADFRDPVTHKSRIAWMLDLSMKPLAIHPELETLYGIKDQSGALLQGAVLTGDDIDTLIAQGAPVPTDGNGHGTHVASIAAGNGGGTKYVGIAPNAKLVIARASRDAAGAFENDDTLLATKFVFDRADAMNLPIVANLSLGTDFGPHDGTSLWEQTIAGFAGAAFPGHAVVVAAGNSGSIVDNPIHQQVRVTDGGRIRVPVQTYGAANSGAVQIWATMRGAADVRVGLDGPDGTWVGPISEGHEQAKNTSDYSSGIIYGAGVQNSPVPQGSHGAIVVWSGRWPTGIYAVTLEGHGLVDLYLTGLGDADLSSSTPAFFIGAVREATVTVPATHPSIISVGCSVDSATWKSQTGQVIGITEPILDTFGGLPTNLSNPARQQVGEGEVCFFSGAGPTLSGVPKPDILAPGAVVVAAMSQQALPGTATSIFTSQCPPSKETGKVDPACLQVDPTHAVALGTSMSSPMVAGVVALLLQQDPTLTQDKIRALLQAGAHRVRGNAPFFDQEGPGEVDALGSLDAMVEMNNPDAALPNAQASWMTLSKDYATADDSTPLTVLLELRTSLDKRASLFDVSRLTPVAFLNGAALHATMVRGAVPGLFSFVVDVPVGSGGGTLTVGASFDGEPIVSSVTLPVAPDEWVAGYPGSAWGGCQIGTKPVESSLPGAGVTALALLGLALDRRKRSARLTEVAITASRPKRCPSRPLDRHRAT